MSLMPGVRSTRTAGRHQSAPEYRTDVNFVVGTSDRGAVNEVFTGSPEAAYRHYGAGDLVNFIHRSQINGAASFQVVRVLGDNAARAQKIVEKSSAETGKLIAKDLGTYGNELSFQIIEHIAGERTLYVRYKGTLLPNGIISGLTDGDDFVNKIAEHPVLSQWITYSKTNDNLPDEVTSWTALTGGSNGDALANSDVIGTYNAETGARTGLQLAAVEPLWSNVAVATFEGDASVNAALISLCANRKRGRTILTHLENASDAAIKSAADSIDAQDGCAAMYTGWYRSYTQPDAFVSPVAALLGILCRNEVYVSPSNNVIRDAVGLKAERDTTQIDGFLLHKVNVVARGQTREPGGSQIKTYHSLSLTSDAEITEIQYKGVFDRINTEIDRSIQFAVSKPHTSILRNMVFDAADMVRSRSLSEKGKWSEGIVEDMWVQCDEQNNPPENSRKDLILDWAIKPIDAAHYIHNRSSITSSGVLSQHVISEVII